METTAKRSRLITFAVSPRLARRRMRTPQGYRRDHLRALAQRVEVAEGEVRIMGSKTTLLRTLATIGGVETAANGVRISVPNWRRGRDSNPRYGYPYAAFRVRCIQPLCHLSAAQSRQLSLMGRDFYTKPSRRDKHYRGLNDLSPSPKPVQRSVAAGRPHTLHTRAIGALRPVLCAAPPSHMSSARTLP